MSYQTLVEVDSGTHGKISLLLAQLHDGINLKHYAKGCVQFKLNVFDGSLLSYSSFLRGMLSGKPYLNGSNRDNLARKERED